MQLISWCSYFILSSGNNSYTKQPTDPSTAKPNTSELVRGIKPSKSTSDLTTQYDKPKDTRKSTSDLLSSSTERNGKKLINSHREQNKIEKQKSLEHNTEKVSSRDHGTEQKIRQAKKEHQSQPRTSREAKTRREKKPPAPQPPHTSNTEVNYNYSSGTLVSSISRSSGPPPYTEELVPNQSDGTGNTSFAKPVETSSWDLVSHHRQQLSRPLAPPSRKGTVLDLGYQVNTKPQMDRDRDHSVV